MTRPTPSMTNPMTPVPRADLGADTFRRPVALSSFDDQFNGDSLQIGSPTAVNYRIPATKIARAVSFGHAARPLRKPFGYHVATEPPLLSRRFGAPRGTPGVRGKAHRRNGRLRRGGGGGGRPRPP